MKISKENYRNFYFGTAAETYIQSEFYSFGYEAYKAQPDIGYDLCVTNNSLFTFEKKSFKQYNVQIKSRFIWDKGTKIYISHTDFEMLLNDKNSILIVVFQRPRIGVDGYAFWEPRDTYNEYIIDKGLELSWSEHLLTTGEIKNATDAEHSLFILGYDKEYFWINNSQLKRLNSDGFIFEDDFENERVYLNVEKNLIKECSSDSSENIEYTLMQLCNKDGTKYTLSNVLFSLKYLVSEDGLNQPFFNEGKMFTEDFDY